MAAIQPLVLVVDDEEKLVRVVTSYLANAGFGVIGAGDGERALSLFREKKPDCLILDINMPGKDGLELTRSIRAESEVPILLLTAMAGEGDKVLGLDLGADDYVTKPFSPRELVSRVRALLRRSAAAGREGADAVIERGGLSLDPRRREVRVDGALRELTAVQFDILAFLARSPGRVYSRLEILEGTAGEAFDGYDRTIDAHVKNIRKALGDDSSEPRFVGTVRGVGYRFLEAGDGDR